MTDKPVKVYPRCQGSRMNSGEAISDPSQYNVEICIGCGMEGICARLVKL